MGVTPVQVKKIVFKSKEVVLKRFSIDSIEENEILVKSKYSLISSGTEIVNLTKKYSRTSGYNITEESEEIPPIFPPCNFEGGKGPGYSLAGEVIEVGPSVTDFKKGDRVFTSAAHASHAICKTDPWQTLKIPENVGYKEATFTALGSVALHGIRKADLKLGEDVVVMGLGVVGLLALQLAKIDGAHPILGVDINPNRLQLARKLLPIDTINPNKENLIEKVRELTDGHGASCTIEATGNPNVIQNALRIGAYGGRIVALGSIVGESKLDLFSDFMWREISLIPAQQPRNPITDTIYYHFTQQKNRQIILDFIDRGELKVSELISHVVKPENAAEIYQEIAAKDENKNMVGVLFDWTE